MTDLQLGLLAIGALIVVLVILYNQWQIRKSRRPRALQPDDLSMEEPVLPRAAEPPAGQPRREPSLGGAAPPAGDIDNTQADVDAIAPENVSGDETADATEAGEPVAAVIDPLIDCIAPIHLERKVSGDRVLPLLGRLRRAGTKQIHVEGLNAERPNWEIVRAGQQYSELQAAVQLANRTGPLNALEFSEFVSALEALTENLDATPELPEMAEAVSNARELDTFAAGCDVQLGVSVISDGAPWSAAYVQNVATQDGLVLSRDGTRFTHYHTGNDGVSRPLFTLQFGDTNFLRDDLTVKSGNQITLLLDVPTAAESAKPFKLICEYAYSLSQRMGAKVVDDNMRPLTEESFVAIQRQLKALYEKLEARGTPAGSPVAVRLFSL
jgi:hypothetical protein